MGRGCVFSLLYVREDLDLYIICPMPSMQIK